MGEKNFQRKQGPETEKNAKNGQKWSKLGHFVGQNDVNIQNLRVGRNDFFLKTVSKVILVGFINITVVKNVIGVFNCIKKAHF